jgi:hypothetical protein
MKLRTEIQLKPSGLQIEHHQKIITIGSCFAENIGLNFAKYHFSILNNPYGVLYNPASVYNSLHLISSNKTFEKSDLIFHDGLWHSWYHHSSYSDTKPDQCLSNLNSQLLRTKQFIENCDFLVITYGTSIVYELINSGLIVSNCHKVPADKFRRFRMDIQILEKYIRDTIALIKSINPSIYFIFTVSPVRHLKDGLAENQISKSSLIVALNNVIESENSAAYFPAYEIMLDDLRDYRFYDKNLVHPNSTAIDYIWDIFSNTWLSSQCRTIVKEMEQLYHSRNHKLFFPDSDKARAFIQQQLDKISTLSKKYSYIDFSGEAEYFSELLKGK